MVICFMFLDQTYYKYNKQLYNVTFGKHANSFVISNFTQSNYHAICDNLASVDPDLAAIMKAHVYPPVWSRPNTFETLVHIILEQQVSLASALWRTGASRSQRYQPEIDFSDLGDRYYRGQVPGQVSEKTRRRGY